MKRVIALTIICIVTLLGCGKKVEPSAEPVTSTSLTEPNVVSKNVSDIQDEVDGIKIDEDSFPDKYFRKYVLLKFDSDKDEYLSDEEISKVKSIIITYENKDAINIESIEGIEYFSDVRECIINNTHISSANFSSNLELEKLVINNDPNEDVKLKKIDISQNTNLEKLILHDCEFEIDVSHLKKLKELNLEGSLVTKIDVSNNDKLEWLNLDGTAICELNLSNNIELNYLNINHTNIYKIDIGNNHKLKYLVCDYTPLSSIDISNNQELLSIYCIGTDIKTIDLSNNEEVFEIHCNENVVIKGEEQVTDLQRFSEDMIELYR